MNISDTCSSSEHIAQREDEAKFDKEFYSQMKAGEVLVIFDYKMKILASMYREKQVDWFSKRGFSCLGCLILFGSSDYSESHDVEYHFFLSDDTTQDSHAVNIAKEILYKLILAKYKVKKVHFRCDGAGCFAAAEAKGMIAKWHALTGVHEASYKTMVPGCGKTSLDGMFGILGQHLSRLVDQGESFNSAEELWGLLDQNPLKYSFFHLFQPQRNKVSYFDPEDTGIKNLKLRSLFYLITCDDDGKVWGFCHSRHGKGLRMEMLETSTAVSDISALGPGPDLHNIYDESISTRSTTNASSKKTIKRSDQGKIDPIIHIVKSSLLSDQKIRTIDRCSHTRSQHFINAKEYKRNKTKKQIDCKNYELKQSRQNLILKLEEQGIFRCRAEEEETKAGCLKEFISPSLRTRHENRCLSHEEKHFFPKDSLISSVLKDARNGKWALCLACGALTNRDSDISDKYAIKWTVQKPIFIHLDVGIYFSRGIYRRGNKHHKKKQFRASPELLSDLEVLFLEGESRDDTTGPKSKASKYSPEQAMTVLHNMMDGERRKYRQGGPHGHLPTSSFIKNWFSRRKNKGATDLDQHKTDIFEKMKKNELKEECMKAFGRDVLKMKGMLIKVLETDDYIRHGGTDGYGDLDTHILKKECEIRNLPTTLTAGAMKMILRGNDKKRYVHRSLQETITMTLALEALEVSKTP